LSGHLAEALAIHGKLDVTIAPHKSKQSRSQQNLFWEWCTALHKHFYKANSCSESEKKNMHDILCHKFLGYETKTVGKTDIQSLKTLTWPEPLSTGEMAEFLSKIDAWAVELGVMLPTPADSEYAKYRDLV
jgi:hypothetical protein